MRKIFVLFICFILLVGCGKKDEPEEKGLSYDELKSALEVKDSHYVYGDESFELTDKFIYNENEEVINEFKYMGLNQYEIVTKNHSYIISYNGTSVYLTVDNGTRHLFKVEEKESEPVDPIIPSDPEEPITPEEPIDEFELSEEELFNILVNGNETWSTGYTEGDACVKFNDKYEYAQGYWPEGTTTGFGTLTNLEYGGNGRYRLNYHWDEVKNSEVYPDRDAYDAFIIVTIKEDGNIDITDINNKTMTYFKDTNTALDIIELWEMIKGEWGNEDGSIKYIFDLFVDEPSIYVNREEYYSGDIVKEFLAFGHYEYMIVFDTHWEESTQENFINLFYYSNEDVIKISQEMNLIILNRISSTD